MSCRKIQTPDDAGSSEESGEDTDTDVSADAGVDPGADSGVEQLPIGLQEPCTANGSQCDAYPEANYCLTDPRTPDVPGFCTIPDCEAGGCPTGYQCCNCFVMVNCMPDEAAETATAEGCICS